MTSAVNKYACLLAIMLLLLGCSTRQSHPDTAEPEDEARRIFAQAADLVERGRYMEAARIYRQFPERFPDHIYADDAAYRYVYLHVTADPVNPLFDHDKARVLFQNFIETYENSRYISACKNWLAVLQPRIGQDSPEAPEPVEIMQLRQQISDLKSENQKLRTTLTELQQAIER